jgi:hypothetical protein
VKATQPKPGEKADQRPRATASVRQPNNQDLTAPLGRAPTSAESAAKIVGVSARTVENVASIQKHAPALIPDIKAGLITIPQAVDRVRGQEDLKRQHAARNDLNLSVVAGLKKTRSCHPHMDPHFLVLCGPYGVGIWTRQKTGFGG